MRGDLIFQLQTTVTKLKQRLYYISPPLQIVFSFPFCFELFLCNGPKYFDSSSKFLQILLLNEEVLRRLISGILNFCEPYLKAETQITGSFLFSAFTLSRSFEVIEFLIKPQSDRKE